MAHSPKPPSRAGPNGWSRSTPFASYVRPPGMAAAELAFSSMTPFPPTPTHSWGKVLRLARRARSQLYWGLKSRFASVPDSIKLNSSQWDAEYAAQKWARLDDIAEVARYMVILGFLDYGVPRPKVLDMGCGHGRLTRLLTRFGFGGLPRCRYLGEGGAPGAVPCHTKHTVRSRRHEPLGHHRAVRGRGAQ